MTSRARHAFDRWLPRFLRKRLDPFDDSIERFVNGCASSLTPDQVILDAGSGESRFATLFRHTRYVAVDSCVGDSDWDYSRLDARADLHQLPFRGEVFDAVLCVVVLEHVGDPLSVLREFARVTRRDGRIWLVTPLLWEEHQKPFDYFRFTSDGLRILLEGAGWEIQDLKPVGGFFWVLGRRSINFLSFFQKGGLWIFFILLAPFFGLLLPMLCFFVDGLDKENRFTLGHRTVAVRSKP